MLWGSQFTAGLGPAGRRRESKSGALGSCVSAGTLYFPPDRFFREKSSCLGFCIIWFQHTKDRLSDLVYVWWTPMMPSLTSPGCSWNQFSHSPWPMFTARSSLLPHAPAPHLSPLNHFPQQLDLEMHTVLDPTPKSVSATRAASPSETSIPAGIAQFKKRIIEKNLRKLENRSRKLLRQCMYGLPKEAKKA